MTQALHVREAEQKYEKAHEFKEEVESDIDDIHMRIELLKKKFADKIADKNSKGLLTKKLEDYFKPCFVDRE